MSDAAAVFQGSYADIVVRKTRSVFVVSVEFPLEAYQAFVAAFGGPTPGAEVPVALARLDPSKPASEPRKGNGEAIKERRKFGELPLSQQAALRCDDPEFRNFLCDLTHSITLDATEAVFVVRDYCSVKSRSEIQEGTPAGKRWRELDAKFLDWRHAVPLAEPTR